MKYEIENEKSSEKVTFSLVGSGRNIVLVAKDYNGRKWKILAISDYGTIHTFGGVSSNLGLELDENEEVQIYSECSEDEEND